MQQQDTTPTNNGEQQEPDWELASYRRRMGAWALDFVGFTLPVILLIIAIVLVVFGLVFSSTVVEESITTSFGTIVHEETIVEPWLLGSIFSSIGAVIILAALVVLIGYIVWWLFTLRRGQTPGKQIVGIRVIKDNGEPSGWGYTFLREFVIKFLLLGLVSEPTLGIARLVDYLWPLWDRAKKMQTLHDKLLGTLVIRAR
ncbi:MAG: RDD family protein [Chloroflexi bacterium]|nr:RDD family protein [Chloroflexota bacterium]